MKEVKYGIEFSKPTVTLLQETGIGTAELAARTCYDSYDQSENDAIRIAAEELKTGTVNNLELFNMNSISSSELLDKLAWTHFHHSILEHASLSYFISGTSRACYSDDTEVLTDRGYVLFSQLSPYDKVLTLNIHTNETSFQKPTYYHRYEVDEQLHHYKNNNIDLLVTKNHRMLYYNRKDNRRPNLKHELKLVTSENIDVDNVRFVSKINYSGTGLPEKIIIKGYTYSKLNSNSESYNVILPDLELPKQLYLELLAAYLSDGSSVYCATEQKFVITISNPNIEKQVYLANVLKELGIKAYINHRELRFNSRQLGIHFKKLKISFLKYIDLNIFDFNKTDAECFIKAYLRWDAHVKDNGQATIYTSSKVLAEQLNILSIIAGYVPNLMIVDRRNEPRIINGELTASKRLEYQIGFSLNPVRNLEPSVSISEHRSDVHYKGNVYCVSVPNETIYVRRKNSNKGVWCGNCLQEHARHRIQSISVRSTRYTMQNILNRYIATIEGYNNLERLVIFTEYIKELDMFVVNNDFVMLEIKQLFDKLELHRKQLGDEEFLKLALSNDAFTTYSTKTSYYHIDVLTLLDSAKNKRNVGDAFKWVVTDNWKVDMVVTMNIRALKNYLTLRDSGAAYFQMRWLAQAIKSVTPNKYLSLIDTECRNKD